MLARLLHVEPNVFRRIALFTVSDAGFPGSLRDFFSLSLICHASYRVLRGQSAPFFHILSTTFDVFGPLGRLGNVLVEEHAEYELKRRANALKILRRGDLDDPDLTDAFWIAYMMFEDSDKGHKNVKHLLATGLHDLLGRYIRQRLYRGSGSNNGWPVPNEQNSLAIALFWLSSSLQSLNRETEGEREEMARLLQPFVFAAFRYPIFRMAECCFDVATCTHQPASSTIHGPYPPPPLLPCDVPYFGPVSRTMRVPSISLFATLSFFARTEFNPPKTPPHLLESENVAVRSQKGPTLADIRYFSEHCHTHFAYFPGIDVGVIRGHFISPIAFVSLTFLETPSYKLGTLTGKWQGSFIVPFLEHYENWLTTLASPPEFTTPGRSPLYMSLQEHYVCDPDAIIPTADVVEGSKNAWLPAGFRWVQKEDGIEVVATNDKGTLKSFYRTFRHGDDLPDRVVDVLITGKTDEQHAAAWGDYEICGRIRLDDGLIMLSRKPLTEDLGTNLLRGYVTSSQNFVGRFKGVSSGSQPAAWEAVYSLCQVRAV